MKLNQNSNRISTDAAAGAADAAAAVAPGFTIVFTIPCALNSGGYVSRYTQLIRFQSSK